MMHHPEIIIPVYNAQYEVQDCLHSMTSTTDKACPVLLINDASTQQGIRKLLNDFAQSRPNTRVIHQNTNQGFVKTANNGFSQTQRDVIILNSDTVTTQGWVERLMECAQSDTKIATATPFSNNAEICSLPVFCSNNPIPDKPDQIAARLAETGLAHYPDLPTGVGFCMYMRRTVIDQLKGFDAVTFGHGYGEENDFCMRAAKLGYRNVLCDNAYVIHKGGASFADTDFRPGGEQMKKLLHKHPEYEQLVHRFIQLDPIKTRREMLVKSLGDLISSS